MCVQPHAMQSAYLRSTYVHMSSQLFFVIFFMGVQTLNDLFSSNPQTLLASAPKHAHMLAPANGPHGSQNHAHMNTQVHAWPLQHRCASGPSRTTILPWLVHTCCWWRAGAADRRNLTCYRISLPNEVLRFLHFPLNHLPP